MNYGFTRSVCLPFETALLRVSEELKKEGFGVLTTIDVKDTLKKKLDVDFKKYHILGACNPTFAFEALQTDENIGLLLPCNVVVYEKGGQIVVAVFDPMSMLVFLDHPKIEEIAEEVRNRLHRAIEAV
jgi:uncharacterized protein (DUF302 family)